MIQVMRTFFRNGEKYLFTKNVFTENINYYFGAIKDLGSTKQITRMYLKKFGSNGNTLLRSKRVEGTIGGLKKSIFRTDHINNTSSCTMINDFGEVIHRF